MKTLYCFSQSFVRECTCTDVSHVAGEGVELTVKERVVVEEIKEELRSRRAQFIYERNYNRNVEFDEK